MRVNTHPVLKKNGEVEEVGEKPVCYGKNTTLGMCMMNILNTLTLSQQDLARAWETYQKEYMMYF